jgi:hypothetical protein
MPPAPTTSPAEAEEEDGDRLMPTRLGNTLRTMEDDAGDRFGLDAVAVAPYLLQVASPDMVSIYEDARTELDVTVKFVYVWMACTVIGFVAFLSDGIWMIVPVVTLFLSWMSYRASIVAARGFGDVLAELVRLYRFDLMTKLHWRLPWHLEEEVEQNKVLWRLLAGVPEEGERRLRYQHPMES